MSGVKKGLIGLSLLGIISVSGCSIRLGGLECVDLRDSPQAPAIEAKADELAKSDDELDRKMAIEAYGGIGKLDKMDDNIYWLIKKDLNSGLNYSDLSKRYHKMYKIE